MHRQTVWRTLKSNTLGASSTVYTNDLVKYQSATILTGLQGRLKGLNVSPFRGMQLLRTDTNTKSDIVGAIPNVGGGIYGDNSEFLISARGQSPIAIVDGVERDLYSIDPEAIESVTIQKDALSNMFLGMRSSRGALIITTKNRCKRWFPSLTHRKVWYIQCIEIRSKSTFGLSICLFAQRSIA